MNELHAQHLRRLEELLALPTETEVVEFKTAREKYSVEKLSQYVSALANEANLRDKPEAWLVMGVDNNHNVVGTNAYANVGSRERLKNDITQNMSEHHTFSDIWEVDHPGGRVLMFRIPAAPRGTPIAYKGIRYGREGDSVVGLSYEKETTLRSQSIVEDWSAVTVPGATVEDLDPDALEFARAKYLARRKQLAVECSRWDPVTFLNKAKLARNGAITRAALLLLGREEAEALLPPSHLKISWILLDAEGERRDYAHFGPPFLLAVEKVMQKIRNLKYRYLPTGTLFPEEIDTYDPYVIREALHNCIAHRDYAISGRISVSEYTDRLVFSNVGSFIPGSVESVLESDAPENRYRNPCLIEAMENLNMLEYIGSGIQRMFTIQRNRFFPLPDYDLSRPEQVTVTIMGKILDPEYARLLAKNPELALSEIVLLDKVQKCRTITKEAAAHLRRKGFIEGRYPKYYIAKTLAMQTGHKVAYSQKKGLPRRTYETMILETIRDHGSLSRKDVDKLLWDALSSLYNEKQRKTKIHNILGKMSRDGLIANAGTQQNPKWVRRDG